MPRGGPRPGFGGKQPGAGRPRKKPLEETAMTARPRFESSGEFGIWVLNAPDAEVSMSEKIRAMQAMLAHAGKGGADKPEPKTADEATGGLYATRALAVLRGGKG